MQHIQKIAIVGATGYGGLELLRLLHQHPQFNVTAVYNTSADNPTIDSVFPHLKGMYNLTLSSFDSRLIMQNNDAVFFATSSGVSKDLAQPFIEAKFPVIDLSGDFRLTASDYQHWYHKQPADSTLLQQAEYGLADFPTDDGINATYIANPGCYATATLLALAPLAQHDLLDPDNMIIDAKSGLSGAGKSLSTASHFINVNENFSMYKPNAHQHIPEIVQQLHKWQNSIKTIQFTTSLLPINRGIFISAYVKLTQDITPEAIHNLYTTTYANKSFIRVQALNELPNIKSVVGTNFTDIGLSYNPQTQYLTIVSVIDNMIKGAAGQAIQNLNLLAGLPDTTGLSLIAAYA